MKKPSPIYPIAMGILTLVLAAVVASFVFKFLFKRKIEALANNPAISQKRAKIEIMNLGKALDMYFTDCNRYPTTEEGLKALITPPISCPNWGPDTYIRQVMNDPWGRPYVYESKDKNHYTLKSLGANPLASDDDIELE